MGLWIYELNPHITGKDFIPEKKSDHRISHQEKSEDSLQTAERLMWEKAQLWASNWHMAGWNGWTPDLVDVSSC